MGIFGRTVSTKDEHEKELEKALELKKNSLEVGKLSKKRSSLFGTQGDPHELLNALEDPSDTSLGSFIPASLQCMNKFQPALHFHKPKDMNEVLGMAGHAPTAAQQAVVQLSNMKMDGPGGVHALAMVGGVLVIIGSVLNFFHGIMKLSPLHMFFSCMLCIFGATILVLEQQNTFFPRKFRAMLEEYFLFLRIITGRGLFFLYVGTIQASCAWKTSTLNVIIGFYMIFVGVMYLFVGRSVEAKLRQIRAMLQSPTFINLAFDDYDTDGSGYLDMEELGKLIAVLGSMLPAEEVMIWMDKNGDGKISKEEFLDWMERPKHSR